MTPELYKYWYDGGRVEARFKNNKVSKWEVLPQRESQTPWYINDRIEYRKARTPHKHAEVIKAWADGAKIERKVDDGDWETVGCPLWNERYNYRIKPE